MNKYRVRYRFSSQTTPKYSEFDRRFNKRKKQLVLSMGEIRPLVTECRSSLDTLSVCFPEVGKFLQGKEKLYDLSSGIGWWRRKGNQDCLVIHGVDGIVFDLEYEIGRLEGSFYKENVGMTETMETLDNVIGAAAHHFSNGYEFRQW